MPSRGRGTLSTCLEYLGYDALRVLYRFHWDPSRRVKGAEVVVWKHVLLSICLVVSLSVKVKRQSQIIIRVRYRNIDRKIIEIKTNSPSCGILRRVSSRSEERLVLGKSILRD